MHFERFEEKPIVFLKGFAKNNKNLIFAKSKTYTFECFEEKPIVFPKGFAKN